MIDYRKLRASLYIPAVHQNLSEILHGAHHAHLQSVIVCTEDAIGECQVEEALKTLRQLLTKLPQTDQLLRFIRPRSPAVLRELLQMPGIDRVHGFVIPKADAETLPEYLLILGSYPATLMPILETAAVFAIDGVVAIRQYLTQPAVRSRIAAVRIGGNDLLGLLGLKRTPGVSVYETPVGLLIPQLVMAMKPFGFRLTGVACDDFSNPDLLRREARQDRLMGLFGKTAIHPAQIEVIRSAFEISPSDFETAHAVMRMKSQGVFSMKGMMIEPAVHLAWAQEVVASTSFDVEQNSTASLESKTLSNVAPNIP